MKRILSLLLVCMPLAMMAQTLNIVCGEITYKVPASQAGNMTYTDGSTLTVMGKVLTISDITRMYVDNSEVTDNSVDVAYNGTSAAVTVAGSCMQYVTVNANGAHVSVVQHQDLANELTYTLSGTSTNGSFYTDGDYKATVVFNSLTLTCADSAAVNIDNGKRIAIDIEGTNILKDSSTSTGKGALMVNGHSEITGSGTLNLYGYAKHGYWADEYIQLKKSFTGSLNVLNAAKDGINVNQYFQQNGGTVTIKGVADDGLQVAKDDSETGYVEVEGGTINMTITGTAAKGINANGNVTIADGKSTPTITITTSGAATYDSTEKDTKAAACISSDANITISAGTITLTSTGTGGKGIKCDSVMTINGGDITVKTTGSKYTYSSSHSYAKGIKALGNLIINGGTVNVTTTGTNAEGIESKKILTINDGTVTVNSYDDAINSASHMYIKGGTVNVSASNNDGLDANGNLYIQGGTIAAYGTTAPECGIDANEEQNYHVYFTGGTLIAIGGSNSVPANSSSTQAYVTTTGTVTSGNTVTLKSGTTELAKFTLTRSYSSSGGGGGGGGWGRPGGGGSSGGSTSILITCPGLKSGSSYTIVNGSTSSSVTATLYGSSGGGGGRW